MTEGRLICEAPKALAAWVASEQDRLDAQKISGELRLPSSTSDVSKALLELDGGPIIGSLTVWSQGMVEFIVVDVTTGENLRCIDIEITDHTELQSTLSNFLDEFIEVCSKKAG